MKTQRLTGKVLQKAIIDLAHTHGWRVAHFASVPITRRGKTFYATPVEADGAGWPDLFLVRDRRAFAIEVKGDGDTLRDQQQEWLSALVKAGIEAYVVTAKDWRDGRLDALLT